MQELLLVKKLEFLMNHENSAEPEIVKQLVNHQGFRRYFSNISWLMAENLLRLIAGLFIDFMKKQGYILYADTYINSIFVVKQSWLNRKPC